MRLTCSFIFVLLSLSAAERVDKIWAARYVVTMDAGRRIIDNGAVAIRGDRIVAAGTRADIDRQYKASSRLDLPDAILAPGLIDTHTHAAMSLMRGIADDRRLQDWLQNYIFPAEARNVTAEYVRWGTRLACLEMALSGTTTYTDMYYFEDVVAEATKEAGLRGVLGQTIIGFPAPDYKTPEAGLAGTEKYLTRFRNDPLIVPAVAPHAIYTTPDNILKASRALANKYQVPLIIHLAETKAELEESKAKRKGMTPTQALEALGVLDGRTLGAHGIWLEDGDIAILAKHGTGLAHCPTSNTKLASGIARVLDILKAGIPMGLGTDGFAGSNNSADLMGEMALAAKLQKVTHMDPEVLPAGQALEMATITGARALGLDKEIGSIEAGKKADLIMVRTNESRAVPMYNVLSVLVYSLRATDVSDVMVNGKQIVQDHHVVTLDARQIFAKAREFQTHISASLVK